MNQQPTEKPVHDISGDLDVHSIFLTIQGEGPFTGQRAVFVRLAGCNLQCPGCDTDYTSVRNFLAVSGVMALVDRAAKDAFGHLVVITGGEPFRQNLRPFIDTLLYYGYRVQIETNGTLWQDLPFSKITVVCSPKTGSINKKLLPHIAALKYVVHADSKAADGLPIQALRHQATPVLARPPKGFSGIIYIQPTDEMDAAKNQSHLKEAIHSVFEHGYTLCLQTHKIIEVD